VIRRAQKSPPDGLVFHRIFLSSCFKVEAKQSDEEVGRRRAGPVLIGFSRQEPVACVASVPTVFILG
jgi:hypothetical protein